MPVTVGEATLYGDWSDTHETQFIVVWGEAGSSCTVLMLGGCDYGGGVTVASSEVPLKEAEAVCAIQDDRARFFEMGDLVARHATYRQT